AGIRIPAVFLIFRPNSTRPTDPIHRSHRSESTPTIYAALATHVQLSARVNWADARCRDGAGTLTHLFFSDELLDIARAKAICARCTLRAECLDGALERAEPWGVWGGELIENGQLVLNKRPRGRPPKHARPIQVV